MIGRIEDRARQETLQQGWVQHVIWHEQLDSTNSEARRWIESNPLAALPALFVADHQTAGRGRSDHAWWSPKGCLMLTLVIDSDLLPNELTEWSQLALVCGVATAETVADFLDPRDEGQRVKLKWPNDIYLADRKTGGILIESATRPPASPDSNALHPSRQDSTWLIGIGLNVAMDWSTAPAGIADRSSCLAEFAPPGLQLPTVMVELIANLEKWITGWRTGELQWQEVWRQRCLLTGRIVRARAPNGNESIGMCQGVDARGHLILRNEQGIQRCNSAEIIDW